MSNREDCFANSGKYCSALNDKNCYKCRFYRNNINRAQIEKDVINYAGKTSLNYKKKKEK